MKKQQSGFTLIELIAVLVILGILAATALPRFIDLSDEAQTAVVDATAGSIESSSSLNYAVAIASAANLTTDTFVDTDECTLAVVNTLLTEPLPAGWTVAQTTGFPTPAVTGSTATCRLTNTNTDPDIFEDFLLIYTAN